MDKTFISRSYILVPGIKAYILQYYLISDFKKELPYGVEVKLITEDITESNATFEITDNLNDIMKFIEILAESFVMPVSLSDILEDCAPISEFNSFMTAKLKRATEHFTIVNS